MAREGLRITVKNLSGTIARIHSIYPDVVAAMRALVHKYAELTVARTKSMVQVRSGFMRSHTRYVLSNDRLAYEAGWFAIDFESAGKNFYPPYREFGTRFQSAHPTLLPTHEVLKPQMVAEARVILQEAIRRRRSG